MSRPLVVDLYARLSKCPVTGRLENVDKQLRDGRAVAKRNGWTIGRELRDDTLSAWRIGVRRPDWEELLRRMESGESDGCVVWHTDRLYRQPMDLEHLFRISDCRPGLVLASAYGTHDLNNTDHRATMRILVTMACKASDDASRRIKSKFQLMRETGRMTGRARAFGFPGGDRTQQKRDGKLPPVPEAQVARERAELRQAAEDVAAGLAVAAVAERWNAAGLRTATGAAWTPVQVRQVLTRPINAGLIAHRGVVVGRLEGEPILDRELHDRVLSVFAARRRGRTPGAAYLASGILICGVCDKPLSGRPHTGAYPDGERRRQYHCPAARGGCGRVAADVRRVDTALRDLVLRRLGDPRQVSRLAAAASETARRLAELAEQIARAQELAEQIGERLGRGQIDLAVFDSAVRPLTTRIAGLQAERDALAAPEPGALPDPGVGPAELARTWEAAELAERRALLSTALRGYRARLLPAGGRRSWSADRLQLRPLRSPDVIQSLSADNAPNDSL